MAMHVDSYVVFTLILHISFFFVQRQSYYTVRHPIAVGMHFLDVAATLPRQAFLGIFRAFILHTRAEVVRVFVVVAVKRTAECLGEVGVP